MLNELGEIKRPCIVFSSSYDIILEHTGNKRSTSVPRNILAIVRCLSINWSAGR